MNLPILKAGMIMLIKELAMIEFQRFTRATLSWEQCIKIDTCYML